MQKIITDHIAIASFLTGTAPDYKGRYYNDILNCSDEVMEQCHDQVQWMFPLHEESNFAMVYPIIDEEFLIALKKFNKTFLSIQANLSLALNRMEYFYGIDEDNKIRQKEWCKNFDHNLLRITRIIRCLRLFELNNYAQNFFSKVVCIGIENNISYTTLSYWTKALKDDKWNSLR